jgi:hypothetical protein
VRWGADGLDQIGRRWPWHLLREVPVVANGHMTGPMKALHMANHLGDDAAQSVADGKDACAVELRGLYMQQVVDAFIWHFALEDVEGREIGCFLNPQSALHKQLEQRPVPEAVGLLRPRPWMRAGRLAMRARCIVPSTHGERTDRWHLAFEIEHGGRDACACSFACLVEAESKQRVPGKRDRGWSERWNGESGSSPPGAKIAEESAYRRSTRSAPYSAPCSPVLLPRLRSAHEP